jgi:N-acylneuraminate cytidylyltransferase/CMP-N,N'-diacetyllegionaminic acid synthase
MIAGKPLLAWTIDAAREAAAVSRIVVSTEDDEIAECAAAYGAEVPARRPQELANDETPGIEPVLHMVRWLEANDGRPDLVIVLQPTSPLRTAADIDTAVAILDERRASAVVSVTDAPYPAEWLKRTAPSGALVDAADEPATLAHDVRQSPLYVLNGAIYLATRDQLVERQSFYSERTFPYVMPAERSLDIDSLWDFEMADLILSARRQGVT